MKKGIYKNCLNCGEIFYEYPYQKGKKKFCSTDCSNKANASKLSEMRKGKGNPAYGKDSWNKGKEMDEKHKKNWRKSIQKTNWGKNGFKKGNKTKTQFEKGHEGLVGETNGSYVHGLAKEPYAKDWNERLKRKIKVRDNYTCVKCGFYSTSPRIIRESKNWLTVHHIDYDKKNCEEENLITLCHRCNVSVNKKEERRYWAIVFNKINKLVYDIK